MATRQTTTSAPLPAFIDPAELPDEYAMRIDGDCLAPEIPHDTRIVINKTAQIGPGDFVCIFWRPERVKPGRHQGVIKRWY